MINRTFICDGCGKTIQDNLVSHLEFFQFGFEQDGLEDKHYCTDCAVRIYQFVTDLEIDNEESVLESP